MLIANNIFPGDSLMAEKCRCFDWASSPIGEPAYWPAALKVLIPVLLASNQPMFVVWGGLHTLIYNDAYAEILGQKHPRALGRSFLDVWNEIRADLTPIVDAAFQGRPTQMDDIELWMERHGFREETHFSFFYSPLRDEVGDVAGFFCACNEITGQVLAERLLAESEAQYRLLFTNMTEGFYLAEMIWDEQGNPLDWRYLEANAAFAQTGVEVSQTIGRTAREVNPDIESEWIETYGRVVQTGLPAAYEAFAAGFGKWFETFAFKHSENRFALLFRDITNRKQIEQELHQANERKDEFIATLAHELRNPLAPLHTGLSILERIGDTSADAERTRKVMERQLTQLVRLVDDLLDVSRVSRGEVVLQKSVGSLQSMVNLAVETSQSLLDTASHHLRVELPSEPSLINADAPRITQVLSNILNNAAKYTPDGGHVCLRVERIALDRVRLQVEDNGTGIPADMLESIFGLFTQVNNGSGGSQGGLGIGLSLSRRLVELHGGTLIANSAGLGQGSVFTLELPTIQSLPPANMTQQADTVHCVADVAGKSVLVVDDNMDAAEVLSMMLQLIDQDVRVVHTGGDALTAFSAVEAPDVVFLDIGLPDINGYEVATELRRRPAFDRTIIVALTGWGAEHDKERAFAAGFDLHLTKPVALEDLLTAMAKRRQLLQGSI